MKLNETFTYDGATVEQVYSLISSQEFRDNACKELGDIEHDVTVEANGDGCTIAIARKIESDMPDFIRKLTGETVSVKQQEKWGAPQTDGSRKADVTLRILGQPAEMNGTAEITESGGDTKFVVNGDVKVSIPFLGKKIEPEVAKAITKTLRKEVELGKAQLS